MLTNYSPQVWTIRRRGIFLIHRRSEDDQSVLINSSKRRVVRPPVLLRTPCTTQKRFYKWCHRKPHLYQNRVILFSLHCVFSWCCFRKLRAQFHWAGNCTSQILFLAKVSRIPWSTHNRSRPVWNMPQLNQCSFHVDLESAIGCRNPSSSENSK